MLKAIIFLLVLSITLFPNASLANFSDVGTTHQYQEAINNLKQSGCISGYQDGTFKPDKSINRAETLKLILSCLNIPKIYSEETFQIPNGSSYILNGQETKVAKDSELKIKIPFNPETYPSLQFSDVNNQEWFIPTLKEALVREIITGYSDNTIKAEKTVAKGEFFAMLYRIVPKELQKADLSKDLAKDALTGQWFTEPLAFAVQNKIIGLDADGNINPFRELNRGQVAHFIYLYKNWLNPKLANNTQPQTPQTTEQVQTETATTQTPNNTSSNSEFQIGYTESGKASFVGRQVYKEAQTAAHNTFPMNSIVKVTNVDNQKYVKVRIIDRGPNQSVHPDRVIDLSYDAFEAIGDPSAGILNVQLTLDSLPS